ncbi:MAG: hypothetical protein EZS28_017202 [Streblomastix strix]|uniref:Uncharacterized protein n=1 Tax=Streblomastix strix TaxID=222440 RepID=A0A5J4VYD7_9EUKA|nr:MAG: hypothetical protein EZS28_017202 [Streblomastix strix]
MNGQSVSVEVISIFGTETTFPAVGPDRMIHQIIEEEFLEEDSGTGSLKRLCELYPYGNKLAAIPVHAQLRISCLLDQLSGQ